MKDKPLTPVRAIRLKCLECGSRPKEVRLCEAKDCYLYAYRFGRNPRRKGIGGKTSHFKSKSPSQLEFLQQIQCKDSKIEAMSSGVKNLKTSVLGEDRAYPIAIQGVTNGSEQII